jgi:hypothetical protein
MVSPLPIGQTRRTGAGSDPTPSFTNHLTLRKRSYGYIEEPRNAPAVASLELTSFTQSLGLFTPKKGGSDPEVMKGRRIAVGSCISCHNFRHAGGRAAGSSFFLLAAMAANSKENFRKKVIDPRSTSLSSRMPPYTIEALYFNNR